MNYFKIPHTGLNSALERIKEISQLTGLVTGVERSDQISTRNSYVSSLDNLLDKVSRKKFGLVIDTVAKEHDVDPQLVKAVIEQESQYNPNAVSNQGAMGLMQLTPETAREVGVKNPFDPVDNIRGGTKYLSSLLNRYHGNVILALSAYNAGPNSVDKYKGVPPFEETKKYVKAVISKLT